MLRSCIALAVLLLLASLSAVAQPAKRLCFLSFDQANKDRVGGFFFDSLKKLGYVEGRNLAIHTLLANGDGTKFPDLARECVRLRADVIVTQTTPAAQAALKATSTIPIIIGPLGDPVGSGLVASFARPGGNLTGSTFNARGLAAKRLELIRELLPKAQTIAVLSYLVDPIARAQVDELEKSAKALNARLVVRDVRSGADLEPAVEAAVGAGAEAIMTTQESFFYSHRPRIVALAAKHRLPGVYLDDGFVREGGLLSFAASLPQLWAGSADYVDRVLKGAKPADLPVQQPSDFLLAVNNKTAKAMGIAIPKSVLVRATTIID